jgi:hypothetical protein
MALAAWDLVGCHEVVAGPGAAHVLTDKAARLKRRYGLVGAPPSQARVFVDRLIRPSGRPVVASGPSGQDKVRHRRIEAEYASASPCPAVYCEETFVVAQQKNLSKGIAY